MADDRTATGTSPSSANAARISAATPSGTVAAPNRARISADGPSYASGPASRGSAASASTRSPIPLAATNSRYAAVVTTNPGGTGMPARVSSPRLAPLPPATAMSPRPSSSKRRMKLSRMQPAHSAAAGGTQAG